MSAARLKAAGKFRWALSGTLDFGTVPVLWKELSGLIEGGGRLTLSLRGVNSANSAGLVLLLEAHDLAKRTGCRLSVVDLPPGLVALASMSQAEPLIAS